MKKPTVKNIKVHFRVCESKLGHLRERLAELYTTNKVIKHFNFYILKKASCSDARFTYTIFPTNAYVNATGLSSFEDLATCLSEFGDILHLRRNQLKDFKIDNITASGQLSRKINLAAASSCLARSGIFCQASNNFPGIVVKFPNLGTILLFSSGKYSIVGLKCAHNSTLIVQKVNAVLHTLLTIKKDLGCVLNAPDVLNC